ncbi:MAG: hypothetical protein AAF658_11890 [Myxococcota bacterium]
MGHDDPDVHPAVAELLTRVVRDEQGLNLPEPAVNVARERFVEHSDAERIARDLMVVANRLGDRRDARLVALALVWIAIQTVGQTALERVVKSDLFEEGSRYPTTAPAKTTEPAGLASAESGVSLRRR